MSKVVKSDFMQERRIQSVVDRDQCTTYVPRLEDREEPLNVLVLDARLRQSLVTMRSLGRRGLRVAALETSSNLGFNGSLPIFSSRWCEQKFVAPAYEVSIEPYLGYLEQLLGSTGARLLISSSDGSLAVIRQHREQLERYTRIALAKEPALEIAINKDRTLEIAKRLGIGVPRGVNVKSVDEVPDALHEIGLPAVVKPVESWIWGEQKGERLVCHLVTTPDEARHAVEELTCSGCSTLFQKFLPGRREGLSFIYANGEIYARFAQWAKRTHPPLGGISVLRQSIAIPEDIGDQAERLIREIDLEGYSEVEFRRDSNGYPYLMEINPRLSASVEVAVRAGVDFPYLLYQWANEEPIDHVQGYHVGRWMRYLEGDLLSTVQSLVERGRPGIAPPGQVLFDFLMSFFKPMSYDYFDWRDPLPASTASSNFVRHVLKRLNDNFHRHLEK